MDITSVRLASAAILLLATVFFGMLPPLVFKFWQGRKKSSVLNITSQNSFVLSASHFGKKKRRIFSYDGIMKLLMFFGGGVLLATCFVHLIPEVRENFDNYFAHHKNSLSDHSHNSHSDPQPLVAAHSHSHSHSHPHPPSTSSSSSPHVHSKNETADHHRHDEHHDHDHHHHHHSHDENENENELATTLSPGASSNETVTVNGTSHENNHDHDHDDDHDTHDHPHGHDHSENGENGNNNPDSLHSASDHHDHSGHNHSHDVPYVELAICGGFFFIYLLEELVHTFVGHKHDDSDGSESIETSSASGSYSPDPSIQKSPLSMMDKATVVTSPVAVGGPGDAISPDGSYVNFAIDLKNDSVAGVSVVSSKNLTNSHPQIFHTSSCDALVVPSPQFKSSNLTQDQYLQPATVRFIQGFVVIIAFSAHSVFDGVAIGLQEEPSRLWTMFFAICSHKLVVALAVGK